MRPALAKIRAVLRRAGVALVFEDGAVIARPYERLTGELQRLIYDHYEELRTELRREWNDSYTIPLRPRRRGYRYTCHGCARGCWNCGAYG